MAALPLYIPGLEPIYFGTCDIWCNPLVMTRLNTHMLGL